MSRAVVRTKASFKALVEAKLEELGSRRSPVPIDVPAGQEFPGPCVWCGKEQESCVCVDAFSGASGPFSYVPYDERKREWFIETRHGKLWLTVYEEDQWIAGLWEDWPRAKAAGMDHWKWNHHYTERQRPDVAAAYFVRELRTVLQWAQAFNETMGFAEAQQVLRGDRQGPREILGVGLGASWLEVRKAYRAAVLGCHPDRIAETGLTAAQAHEQLKRVNAAFSVLKHEMGQ